MSKKLNVHVVLDRSGSMQAIKQETIGAFNTYIETLAKENPKAELALTLFDSAGIDTTPAAPISEVKPLNDQTYVPRAMTPLYDAIGKAAGDLAKTKGKAKALVILTDGLENCSREWAKLSIRDLLNEKQAEGWLVLYLGANQDAFKEGGAIGTRQQTTMTFDTKNIGATLAASARATASYGAALSAGRGYEQALTDSAFTVAEREKAKGAADGNRA